MELAGGSGPWSPATGRGRYGGWLWPVCVGLIVAIVAGVLAPARGFEPRTALGPASVGASEIDCHGVQWFSGHLEVGSNGCQSLFAVNYAQDFSNWTSSGAYNFSFSIGWVAEIDGAGHLVRLGNAIGPSAAQASIAPGRGEVNVSVTETLNITAASGNWTPTDAWSLWNGTNWTVGDAPVGTASLGVVFHLANVTGAANSSANQSTAVKFDVDLQDWPWASSDDHLGFELGCLGAGGSHFTYQSTNRTLLERWNASNRTFVTLEFGGEASVQYPNGTLAVSTTGVDTHLFYAASRDRQAVALVTFGGATGNYTSVHYDPRVAFVPEPPGSPANRSGAWWWLPLPYAVAGGGVATICLLVIAVWAHGRKVRREGNAILGEIDRILAQERGPPGKRD